MTNKIGVTFIPGCWYKCNFESSYFCFMEQKFDNSNGLWYSKAILKTSNKGRDWMSNKDYYDNATPVTDFTEIKKYFPDVEVKTNYSYEIY